MATDHYLENLIETIGEHLGFKVAHEVEAGSESAYVDVVWFDKNIYESLGIRTSPRMRHNPVLPIVGFEVEKKTALNAKHVKGSISNLDNLGAQMGVLVIGSENLESLRRQTAHAKDDTKQLEKILMARVYKSIYEESKPRNRIVVMWQKDVEAWAKNLKIDVAQSKTAKDELEP
jgi:hypothetical protein